MKFTCVTWLNPESTTLNEKSKLKNGTYRLYHVCILITHRRICVAMVALYVVKILNCEFTLTLLG